MQCIWSYLVIIKSFYWTNKSAIQGNSDAQNNLGLLYYYGQGVDKNIKKSRLLVGEGSRCRECICSE
uniref:tetratricopeptide repeat protein n=1 Tax=Serratia marcescens TaxID=615 RepID=UPI003B586330